MRFHLLKSKNLPVPFERGPPGRALGNSRLGLASSGTAGSAKNCSILGIFAITGILVCIVQVRFFQFTHILCIPAAAWVMSNLYDALQREGVSVKRVAALIAMPLIASPWIVVLPKIAFDNFTGTKTEVVDHQARHGETATERSCQSPADRAALAAMTSGVAAAPVFYGSTVLAYSKLSVLAAPYPPRTGRHPGHLQNLLKRAGACPCRPCPTGCRICAVLPERRQPPRRRGGISR